MNKIIIILLLLLTNSIISYSQFRITKFGIDDGLPHRKVTSVSEDEDGYLWIKTQGGLVRYDGLGFEKVKFQCSDSLQNSFRVFPFIEKTAQPFEFVGYKHHNDFLILFNSKTLTLSTSPIPLIEAEHNWSKKLENSLATISMFYAIEKSKEKKLNDNKHETENSASVLVNEKDRLFEYNEKRGFNLLLEDTPQIRFPLKRVSKLDDELLIHDNAGNIFVNKGQDFKIVYNDSSDSRISTKFTSLLTKKHFLKNSEGDLISATQSEIHYLKNGSDNWATLYNEEIAGGPHLRINDVFVDSNDILWLSTSDGLIQLVRENDKFIKFLSDSGKTWGQSIRKFVPVSPDSFLIVIENPDTYTYFINNDLNQELSVPLDIDARGESYFIIYDKRKNKFFNIFGFQLIESDVGFKKKIVAHDLLKDYYKRSHKNIPLVWNDQNEMAIFFSEKCFTLINSDSLGFADKLNCNDVNRIISANKIEKDIFWISDESGFIHKIDFKANKCLRSIKVGSSLVYDIIAVRDQLWVATLGQGIFVIENEQTIRPLEINGLLPNQFVCTMLNDDDQFVWVSTYDGLCQIRLDDYTVRKYNESDGLSSNEFNKLAKVKDEKGNFYFGSINGFTMFNPVDMRDFQHKKNKLNLLSTSYFDNTSQEIIKNTEYSNLDKLQFIVPPNYNWFQLDYRLINYINSKKNRYVTRLKGYEDGWSDPVSSSSIRYHALPPGQYTFEVKAINDKGEESINVLSVEILIKQIWYKERWAYLLYALLIALIIFTIVKVVLGQRFLKLESQKQKQLNQLKNRFFVNITHELKTPLTLLFGMVDVLKKSPLEEAPKALITIDRNLRALDELINRILMVNRLDSKELSLNLIQSDVMIFLQNESDDLTYLAQLKNQELKLFHTPSKLMMDFDQQKLSMIYNNLITNAIKYSPKGSTIIVEVCQVSSFLLLKVIDEGIGIHETEFHNIFERFYLINDKNDRSGSGTGVGLAVVKELVELLEGRIELESTVGKGTTFMVYLPITNNAVVNNNASLMSSSASKLSLSTNERDDEQISDKPIILIVEDNDNIREYLKFCLSEYNIIESDNGQGGLTLAFDHIPNLIILDVMMPIMDGFTLLKELKNNKLTDHIPVVMLTAKSEMNDRVLAFSKGADAYMSKPFQAEELTVLVDNLIQQRLTLKQRYSNGSPIINKSINPKQITEEDNVFMSDLMDVIKEKYTDDLFNVEMLAYDLKVSSRQLRRKVAAFSNLTSSELIRNHRLNVAKGLILEGAYSIKEVTFLVGFSNPAYFSKIYKAHFGNSPNEEKLNKTS